MLKFVLAALFATTVLSAPPKPIKWPEIFEPCGTSYPEFNQCAKRNLQLGINRLNKGIPELNVPSFDPLYVPEILFDYTQDNIQGKLLVRNSKSLGLMKAEVLDVRSNLNDPKNLSIDVDFRIPSVFIEGEYKGEGKIIAFPISGKGVYNVSMTDIKGTWGIRGDIVQINDVDYMKVRHVYMYPEVGDLKVYASNLFTGNEELNKAALRFANDYWPAFYKEMLPYAAEGWDKYLRELLNKLFLKVPFRTIFPESK